MTGPSEVCLKELIDPAAMLAIRELSRDDVDLLAYGSHFAFGLLSKQSDELGITTGTRGETIELLEAVLTKVRDRCREIYREHSNK